MARSAAITGSPSSPLNTTSFAVPRPSKTLQSSASLTLISSREMSPRYELPLTPTNDTCIEETKIDSLIQTEGNEANNQSANSDKLHHNAWSTPCRLSKIRPNSNMSTLNSGSSPQIYRVMVSVKSLKAKVPVIFLLSSL